jgi:membrane-bound lytic murein transglycosylase B
MTRKHSTRTGRGWRLAALAPLGVISAAWTLSVAGAGAIPVAAPQAEAPAEPAVSVPDVQVQEPASLSRAVPSAASLRGAGPAVAVRQGVLIPAPAIAAYQRAAAIMRGADEGCRIDWSLLAAIGAVESGHGTAGGSALRSDGVAVPAIVGIRLDGRRGVANISDTDGGRYDGDKSFDRAIGPMQFIPTTWGVVGVDADNDGRRNPQDVDDAALAAAVYLCSGEGDLSTPAGMRHAVLRYNHSAAYVDEVAAIARSYAVGGVATVAAGAAVTPDGVLAAGRPVPRTRGGTDRGTRAAPQHSPAPKPSKPDRPQQGVGGTPPSSPPGSPAPPQTVLTPLTDTLECTVTSLGKLLQPSVLASCLTKLGR